MTGGYQRSEGGLYQYSSQPRALTSTLTRAINMFPPPNIATDPRVIRGNTHAMRVLPKRCRDKAESRAIHSRKQFSTARQRAQKELESLWSDPVPGRTHQDMQTDIFLEELTDAVEDTAVACQTEPEMDRIHSPNFVPAKTGVDAGTQVEAGELFSFDVEVTALLEAMVGKLSEQALLEVMEEEELADIREQQRIYEQRREEEFIQQERMAEKDRRITEEKKRRLQEEATSRLTAQDTDARIAALAFSNSYLGCLVPSVFSALHEHGYFYDGVERDIEDRFLPWLMFGAIEQLTHTETARHILDSTIRRAMFNRLENFKFALFVMEMRLHQAELKKYADVVEEGEGEDGEGGTLKKAQRKRELKAIHKYDHEEDHDGSTISDASSDVSDKYN